LRNIKKVVTVEERQLFFIKIRVLSTMMGTFKLEISPDDVMGLALNFRSLINFDSPRFLIQEVASTLIKMQKASNSFV